MNRLKELYVELFSDAVPTHKCEEVGDYWMLSNYYLGEYPHGYQKLVKNKLGLWKRETCWRGSWEPLAYIGGAR